MSSWVPNGSEVRAWVGLGVSIVSLYYLGKYAGASIRALQDGSQNETATANRARLVAALEARGKTPEEARRIAATAPNKYEATILQEVVFPEQLASTFAEVGGLERMKEELYESIILPLREPELFKEMHSASSLLSIPSGVLLYGPPGTGKSMMARAIAHASGATFINVRPSTLQAKWFGESQKLVRAVFSVAQLYAPSIIFLDECDAFMRRRGSADHEASSTMRGEFLSLWDGLLTHSGQGAVMVLACTNRPFDIDEAFLRRMPRSFFFPLPSLDERQSILSLLLASHELAEDLDVRKLAVMTEGYSGSDLKELCRVAAAVPMRALLKKHTRHNFEAVMHGGRRKSRGGKSDAEAEGEGGEPSQSQGEASKTIPASAASGSVVDAVAAIASASAATPADPAAAGSMAHLKLTAKPRPLSESDFRSSMRTVRPTGLSTMRQLLAFELQHRGAQPHLQADEDEDEDEEEGGVGKDDKASRDHASDSEDSDDIYL